MTNNIDLTKLFNNINMLLDILREENKLLKKFDITQIQNLQKEKNIILLSLKSIQETISENISDLKNTEIIQQIKQDLLLVNELTEYNANLTLKAIDINTKIIEIFVKHLNHSDELIYNNKGLIKTNNSKFTNFFDTI